MFEPTLIEAAKNKILLLLVTKGAGWLGHKFIEKVKGDKPSLEEVESFFNSGLDEDKARNLLKGFVNDLVKTVEMRFRESELGPEELEPVASYLATLLDRLEVTTRLADQYQYDPAALSRYAESLAKPGEMAAFSEPQRLLVREVLRNLGAPLLRLGFDLPSSVSLLHRRSGELQQTVDEMRVAILRTREISESLNPDRHLSEFEEAYRTRLVESLNVMELLGLDEIRRNLRRYPLEASFVHLRLEANKTQVKFEVALEEHRRLFLKGTAGSGKTTLMRWLTIMAARGELDRFPHLKGKLPVLVTLRDYNRAELPSNLKDLLGKNLFMPPVSPQRVEEVLHERFRLGRVLILVDGVDEVGETKLAAVREWVAALIRSYPRVSYVISSRPVVNLREWLGLEADGSPRERFAEAMVEKMNDAELDDLVVRWHDAAARAADDTSIRGVSAQLLQTLHSAGGLRELASTPLLASAVCALNLNSAGGLPVQRRQLYHGLIRMMIEKRDRERRLEDALGLSLEQKLLLLASVAARIVEDNDVRISREELVAVLKSRLAMTERRTDSDKVLLYLLERTGLLRQIDQNSFEFVHKTFQEFLAALHFVQERKYTFAGRYLLTKQGGDLSYFMAVLAPDAGPIIVAMLEELQNGGRNPYLNLDDALLYIAKAVQDSLAINLDDGEEIASLYRHLVGRWHRELRGSNQTLIVNMLASKITLHYGEASRSKRAR